MVAASERAELVLEKERLKACQRFEAAKTAGIVSGEFEDDVWHYKGLRLLFREIGGKSRAEHRPHLSDRAGQLGRCFAAWTIAAKVSPELAISRVNAFRWLAKTIGRRDALWTNISPATLNEALSKLKHATKDSTTYHRANGIGSFVEYLNGLVVRIDGEDLRYSERFIRWRHGVPNPIRSTLEVTSESHEARRKDKFEPNLHIALATARTMTSQNPSLEPCPGYDRLRLEPLAFGLALGLRVGEICALPLDVLEVDESTGAHLARIPIEKGAIPGGTAVPEIWEEALREAQAYLLEHCAAARKRAREIETFGFEFVRRTVLEGRTNRPLTDGQLAQLRVEGLDPAKHCFISELISSFSISEKELTADGKYGSCRVDLPRLVAARMTAWLDDRFRRWDWLKFAQRYARTGNISNISVLDVGKYCGTSKASVAKASWYINDLRKFLAKMRAAGIFEPGRKTPLAARDAWRKRWLTMRTQMLSHRGGGSCTAIHIDVFMTELERRYASYLSRHFKEVFIEGGNASGGGFVGNRVRRGMETKLSDHLVVLWEYQFTGMSALGILPRPILRSDFYNYLCRNAQKKTVFERLAICSDDGRPYSFTPHSIRRWVTTALLRSGPSETAIDLWMGRTPRQTRHYDYRTAKERAEYVRARYLDEGAEPNDVLGRKVKFWREEGLSSEQIEKLVCEKLKILHFTPWGGCTRELYISPCNKGLMCLRGFGTESACASFQIDPSDLVAKRNIEGLRAKYMKMLNVIEPNHAGLLEILRSELSTTEQLDQHIAFMIDIVRGCDEALRSYVAAESVNG